MKQKTEGAFGATGEWCTDENNGGSKSTPYGASFCGENGDGKSCRTCRFVLPFGEKCDMITIGEKFAFFAATIGRARTFSKFFCARTFRGKRYERQL